MTQASESLPLRIGIAGVGRMGMYHLERWSLRNDCNAVACYDIDETRCDIAGRTGCRVCQSWRDLLDDTSIDVVWIATPPTSHAELAVEALESRKHVIVEPPLCLALDDADRLLNAAASTGRLLSVAHCRRWDDDFLAAQKALQSGQLGRLTNVCRTTWGYGFPSSARVSPATGWRADPQSNSALIEFGVDYLDQLLTLVAAPVTSVFAQFPKTAVPSDTATHALTPFGGDAFVINATFANGVCGRVDVNQSSPVPLDTGWALIGTDGGYREFQQYRLNADGEVYDAPEDDTSTDWDRFYEALVCRFRTGGPEPTSVRETRRAVELFDATCRSALTGNVIHLETV
jgi:scyllo-inositol 2-dehydrogenase (NADP+)